MRLFTLALALLLVVSASHLMAKQPNILLLFSDDAGYNDFGFQGSETHLTPNLDKLAEGGVRFTRAYVTGPVCSPSRAGLLTGRYQQYFGHENNLPNPHPLGLPLTEKLMPEYLKEKGYGAYMIGKWHLGIPDPYQPHNRGFDHFFGILEGARSYFQIERPSYGKALVENGQVVEEPKDLYVTDMFGDKAVEYLEEHFAMQSESPFFMFLSFTAPHTPMHAKEEDLQALDYLEYESEERKINAAMTYAMDRNIGKVMEVIREHGELENTFIVFLNDNGGPGRANASDNGSLRGHKGTIFEGGVRVPMFVNWPRHVQGGQEFDGVTSAFDLLPTFLSLAGGKPNPENRLEGVSLLPYLSGELEGNPHDALYWRILGANGRKGMIHENIKYSNWEGHEAVFDLATDPNEQVDLAKSDVSILNQYRSLMMKWEDAAMEPLWWWNKKMEEQYRVIEQ
ncbi:sulfatase-like hydrolase/transferase [Cerasicoccus frondis]|uniref:sulfatase-like hydrolase/transferase n=1 Tax=Cerasicoccus frondis TaxID=490090 RepID=UPI00285277A5|nr:sulfatase-like hydrolase/transferase [Cerasicoccus frondis]